MNNRLDLLLKKSRSPEEVVQEVIKFPKWYLLTDEQRRFTRSDFTKMFYKHHGSDAYATFRS